METNNIDRITIINNFCLTAATITSIVAISCMATAALTNTTEPDEIFTLSTKRDCQIDIDNYKSPIKYADGDLCNRCFHVDKNGYIKFTRSGYYTLCSQIKKTHIGQVRLIVYDKTFEIERSASLTDNDNWRNYTSDAIYFNADDEISVLVVSEPVEATAVYDCYPPSVKGQASHDSPAILQPEVHKEPENKHGEKSDYARLIITRIPKKLIHFHKS